MAEMTSVWFKQLMRELALKERWEKMTKRLAKYVWYKMARGMKFFSMLCSITGVKKIVRYNEYSFIPRFCCRAEDRTITTYAFTSQPQLPISREITEESLSKCGLESCAARPHKMWRLASHAGRVGWSIKTTRSLFFLKTLYRMKNDAARY